MQVNDFLNSFESMVIPILGVRLPTFVIEEKYLTSLGIKSKISNYDFLHTLCLQGFNNLKLSEKENQIYQKRTEQELSIIQELGFVDYILLVWDVINFCKENNIPTGLGRGSCAGSLVLYLINVTKIDPIKYGLYFERFISKIRAKKQIINGITYLDGNLMCDVDLDICYYNRYKVLTYLNEKFKGKITKILTFNTLSAKLVIKEVGKIVGGVPEEEMTSVTSMIPKNHGLLEDLDVAYEKVPEFKEWCDTHPLVYETALKLKDLIKNKGVHPSGIMITYDNLSDCCPTELSSDKDIVSSYDMNWVSLFSVKLDALGLRGVSVVDDVCKQLNINILDIDLNDPVIYQHLQDLKYPQGLFQLEADLCFKTTQKVKPKNLQELSAILAVARPGAMQFIDKLALYTNTGTFQSIHPFFDDVLKNTGGLCLFQEQAMKMSNKIGFSLDESEQIRRCITNDTMFVSKQRGWISIKELLDTNYNDDFLIMDETGKQSWGKIKNIWSNGKQQIRYVENKNGMFVKSSRWHQFATDTGWKARNYLSKNDYLICAEETAFEGQDKINRSMAILICGLVTEGYFTSYSQCSFTNHDEELMGKFEQAYQKEFEENLSFCKKNRKVAFLSRKNSNTINKYLNFGLSASKFLPKEILQLTRITMQECLGFLYSCEGSFYSHQNTVIEFSSASELLIHQIQLMLLRFGIKSFISKNFNKKYQKYYYKLIIADYSNQLVFKETIFPFLSQSKQHDFITNIKERDIKINQNLMPKTICKKFFNQYGNVRNYSSGSCYTSDISKIKMIKFAEESKDKFWINFFNGKQFYSPIKNLNKDIREVEVFDFQMEDEEKPYIIANGILIHNCIGKKKTEEIKTWKNKISDKILENKLDPIIGDVLWRILEDSGGYQFNASHSYAYASLSALTVYLKFKYPTQFFLSLLRMSQNEPDPIGEIAKIHKEMQYFGITLLPPSLAYSQMEFSLENQKDIRFGLSSIKGVSDKTIIKLNNFKREHADKFELFESAKEAGLTIGILSALIQAGTLSKFGNKRAYLVYEAQLWNLLKQKEKQAAKTLAIPHNFKLIKIVKLLNQEHKDEKGKPLIKDSRLATIKKHSEKYKKIFELNDICEDFANWWYEKRLLGYVANKRLLDIFISKKSSLIPINEVLETPEDTYCDFIGYVDENPTLGTSRTARRSRYAKYQISDESGSIKVMIFNDSLEECKSLNSHLPQAEDIVIVNGRKKGTDTIFARTISIQQNVIYTQLSELKEEKI